MTDCPHTSKEAAVGMLTKHRAARAGKAREAGEKVEPAKKVGRILLKAGKPSLAKANLTARLSQVCWTPALPSHEDISDYATEQGTPTQNTKRALAVQIQAGTCIPRRLSHSNRRDSQKTLRSLSYATSVQNGYFIMDHSACKRQTWYSTFTS
jgi:hypothetical protein